MKTRRRITIWRGLLLALSMILLIGTLNACGKQETTYAGSPLADAQVQDSRTEADLTVHYLDVGQGSAALLESDGRYVLIDGGVNEYSSFVVSYLKKQGVETLDYVVITHYDADHLAGVIGVLHQFSVNQVLSADYEADTKLYRSYTEIMEERSVPEQHPQIGETYTFGSALIRITGPVKYDYEDENDNSVSAVVSAGSNKFFFGGDMGEASETDLLEAGVDVEADVYLVNHHGSDTATTEAFLEAVDPSAAVISCGLGNSYGHPREAVLNRLSEQGAEIYRTDIQGTLIVRSDGREIIFDQKPEKAETETRETEEYVLNTNTKKFHLPDCGSVEDMKEKNKRSFVGSRQEVLDEGYSPCGNCRP
ncbi:MBL fold metallo-hydrolase [Lacrimispora sp. NSJ-141]|uniref:MBL fold metallo-hydrolase n=1 Tax=Lientehia hominis TaxID=2897778 RepID=A0AAP2RKG9_9FIRM|nr:ComEC/Rec2 family competence protein [Lientehia hominis]MCD2493159.1 MBL fold metallo-hydrolase [Lientehia hominis]